MQIRNDYKNALVDEYKTFWNGYDDENEFYADLLSLSPSLLDYLTSKTKKIVGADGLCEVHLNSQNQLYIIYYCDDKQFLDTINDLDIQKEINLELSEGRFTTRSFFAS